MVTKRIIFLILLVTSSAFAGTSQSDSMSKVEKFDYPELMVVPRASERLKQEAALESQQSQWTQYLPLQISALATLLAGTQTLDSAQPGQGIVGIGVGAGWLALTSLMATSYRPYQSSWQRVKSMPEGSTREQLVRERMSEEQIASASSAGERIRWMSILTNLGAVVTMGAKGGPAGFSTAQAFQIGAAIFAFAPLIYGFHWHDVYLDQREYKKRIYGPVASATLLYDQKSQTYVPGLSLSLRF